jgi:surfactin synthase thioesterase subunit
MDRRAFIGTLAGGLLAAPIAAEAQQAGKPPRIGWLSAGSQPDPFLGISRRAQKARLR